MNLPEFATCFTKIIGATNHTLTLIEPRAGDSTLSIGFKSVEGDESRLEINVEKYLKRCSDLEALIASLKRCGTCKWWALNTPYHCYKKDTLEHRMDTCDKWEMDP